MTTGEKINKIRKMAGMTQEELAGKMNVSRQTISKWETGASSPDLESAVRLCKLFQISLDDFVKETDMGKEEKIGLQDMLRINRRQQRMTILLLSGLFFLMIGALAVLFVNALQSTTLSMEYMLYRYIATGEYAYAPVNYWSLTAPGLILVLIGAILCGICLFERWKERKKNAK
jgi:transcriptional regulator with XRE-family HTH domain